MCENEYFDRFEDFLSSSDTYTIQAHTNEYSHSSDYLSTCRNNIFAEVQAVKHGYGKRMDIHDAEDEDEKDEALHHHLIKYKIEDEDSFYLYPDRPYIPDNQRYQSFDQGFVGSYIRQYINTFECDNVPSYVISRDITTGSYKEYSDGFHVETLTNMGYDAQVKQLLNNLTDTTCPICLDTLSNPCITLCKHIFCLKCIERSLNYSAKCPWCRCPTNSFTEIDVDDRVPCNDDQRAIVLNLRHNLEIIQGPPGTGKSTTIYHIVTKRLLGRTLVTSRNNQAIAAVCEKLGKHHTTVFEGGKLHLVVLGRICRISESSKPFHIDNMVSEELNNTPVIQRARKVISEKETELSILQAKESEIVEQHLQFVKSLNLEQRDYERLIVFLSEIPSKSRCMKGKERYLRRLEGNISYVRMLDNKMIDVPDLRVDYDSLMKAIKVSKEEEGPAFCDVKDRPLSRLSNELNLLKAKLNELTKNYTERYKKHIMKESNVFLSTISSAWRATNITTVIIDEAATVDEESMPGVLKCNPTNLILIGDHKQLKPFTNINQFEPRSFFERMVDNGHQVHMLKTQYRMAPSIGKMVSNVFYSGQLNHGIRYEADTLKWIHHDAMEDLCGTSFYNFGEVDLVYDKVVAYREANPSKTVMVITFYRKQFQQLKDRLNEICKVVTVDACQGTEADAVFLSCVRSNTRKNIGFCRNKNRLCVALSRAKEALFIIGNKNTFSRQYWTKCIKT